MSFTGKNRQENGTGETVLNAAGPRIVLPPRGYSDHYITPYETG